MGIAPNVVGLRTDEQLHQFLQRHGQGAAAAAVDTAAAPPRPALINFGSSWCSHCHQLLPHFLSLARQFPGLSYAVAQVDHMSAAAVRGVTYTPTFAVYRGGRKVDQFFGASEQQLRDHIWLHSQPLEAEAEGQQRGAQRGAMRGGARGAVQRGERQRQQRGGGG